MANQNAKIDDNFHKTLLGITDDANQEIRRLLVDPTTGRLKCTAVVTSGLGITSLNGLTALTQTFATGTTGTDFTISSATSTHTFNLPTASSTNRGLLSTADWTTFNGKQNALTLGNLTELTSAVLTIGSGTGAVVGTGTTITVTKSDSSHDGYLSQGDWSTFNGKLGSLAGAVLLDQTTPQSVINGRLNFVQGVTLGTSPTVGAFLEGKMYYDAIWKTVDAEIDTNTTLLLGQLELRRVYNATGSPLAAGKAVYTTGVYSGGSPNIVTVGLAKADAVATSYVLGVTYSAIASGAYGYIVVRGHVENINTNAFTVGDVVYLDASTAGDLTATAPTEPNLKIRIGRIIVKDGTAGRLNVRLNQISGLNDLADVTISSAVTDQVLRFNGLSWVNGIPGTVSASAGIAFYNATPSIIATGTQNTVQLLTFSKTPVVTAEQTITGTGDASSTPIPFAAWLYDMALGRTTLDAGVWRFQTWANISNATGTTTFQENIYAVLDETGGVTVQVTTIGGDTTTLRTATASGGTPFATTKINVGGTALTDSYLKTTKGLLRIVSRTSDTVVHVATPATYTDDVAGMAFSVWKLAVASGQSPDINTTTASGNYEKIDLSVAAAAYAITTAHKLGSIYFVTSSASRVITLTYNGTARNSSVETPLITLHNNLAGLQGGVANEYYHLTSAQATVATQAATGSVNGYLASGDWTTFNNKASAALGNLASVAINTTLLPASNDGAGLGNGTYSFSDLFLASGGVINWANGNMTLTHSTGALTFSAGLLTATDLTLNTYDSGGLQLAAKFPDYFQLFAAYTGDTGDMRLIINKCRNTIASPNIVASGDNAGAVFFQGYDGVAYQPLGYIQAAVDGTPGTNDMPGRLTFWTTPDGSATPAERMRIDNAGQVGIGITPAYDLHLAKASAGSVVLCIENTNDGGTGTASLFLRDGGVLKGRFDYAAASTQIIMGSIANIPLGLWTNNTERMTINNAGNISLLGLVGINGVFNTANVLTITGKVATGNADVNLSISSIDAAVASNTSNYWINAYYLQSKCNIANTYTDSGYRRVVDCNGMINDSNFAGTLAGQTVINIYYGIYATTGGAGAKTITKAVGLDIVPWGRQGTITAAYDIYLEPLQTGGTVTTHYALYSEDTSALFLIGNLAGTGSRTVVASATGLLSAPVSDERLKTNITPIGETIPMAMLEDDSIKAINYNWKDEEKGSYTELGMTAQMLEGYGVKGLTFEDKGIKGINYEKLTVILWEQNRQLLRRIKQLEDK